MRPLATATRSAASSSSPSVASASPMRAAAGHRRTRGPVARPADQAGDVDLLIGCRTFGQRGDPAADAPVDQVAGGGEQ